MTQTDSFIDEVNEEVRREKLFSALRKYGWIGILAVLVLVGGAAWNEYRKASQQSAAEALGDEILAAVEQPQAEARIAALQAVAPEGEAASVVALLSAAEQLAAEDPAAAADLLRPLALESALPAIYSDLAAFKMVLLGDAAFSAEDRAQVLTRLAQAGAPYRPLALEQQAQDLAAAGQTAEAGAAARALMEEPGLTPALMQRLAQFLFVIGEDASDEASGAPTDAASDNG